MDKGTCGTCSPASWAAAACTSRAFSRRITGRENSSCAGQNVPMCLGPLFPGMPIIPDRRFLLPEDFWSTSETRIPSPKLRNFLDPVPFSQHVERIRLIKCDETQWVMMKLIHNWSGSFCFSTGGGWVGRAGGVGGRFFWSSSKSSIHPILLAGHDSTGRSASSAAGLATWMKVFRTSTASGG